MTLKPFQLYFQEIKSYLLANLIRSLAKGPWFSSVGPIPLHDSMVACSNPALFCIFYAILHTI